jgi:hypothetical protein
MEQPAKLPDGASATQRLCSLYLSIVPNTLGTRMLYQMARAPISRVLCSKLSTCSSSMQSIRCTTDDIQHTERFRSISPHPHLVFLCDCFDTLHPPPLPCVTVILGAMIPPSARKREAGTPHSHEECVLSLNVHTPLLKVTSKTPQLLGSNSTPKAALAALASRKRIT